MTPKFTGLRAGGWHMTCFSSNANGVKRDTETADIHNGALYQPATRRCCRPEKFAAPRIVFSKGAPRSNVSQSDPDGVKTIRMVHPPGC